MKHLSQMLIPFSTMLESKMKFLVTDIEFDFNTDMPDYYSVSFDDQQLIVNDNLGVWEADD